MDYLFSLEGVIDEIIFSNNAFVVKEENGDLNYIIFQNDYPETMTKLRKYLRRGSHIKSICTLAGARYLQIVELNIY